MQAIKQNNFQIICLIQLVVITFFTFWCFLPILSLFYIFQGLRGPGTPYSKFMKILPNFFFCEVEHFYGRAVLILRQCENHGAFDAP